MTGTKLVSIIIPCYNEEKVIEKNVRQIIDLISRHSDYRWEIICVNDGSKDGTGQILDDLAKRFAVVSVIHHPTNYGQGRGLRNAFAKSQGEYIITMDADLSYDVNHITELLAATERVNADIYLVSAYMDGGVVENVPPLRRFLSRWGNRFLCFMYGQDIHVMSCVVRLYKRKVIETLELFSEGMEINLEVLNYARIANFKMTEIPGRLIWRKEKTAEAKPARVSKMRLVNTIKSYFRIGTFFRPSLMMSYPAVFFIIVGILGSLRSLWIFFGYWGGGLTKQSIVDAVIKSFETNFPTILLSAFSILLGFLLVILGIIARYLQVIYEDNYRLHCRVNSYLKDASPRVTDRSEASEEVQ